MWACVVLTAVDSDHRLLVVQGGGAEWRLVEVELGRRGRRRKKVLPRPMSSRAPTASLRHPLLQQAELCHQAAPEIGKCLESLSRYSHIRLRQRLYEADFLTDRKHRPLLCWCSPDS